VVSARGVARRALPAAVAAGAVVAILAGVRPRLQVGPAAPEAPRRLPVVAPGPAEVRRVSALHPMPPGRRRTATGIAIATPFSIVQVRVTLAGRRLARVETVELSGENARSDALNAHAEPILRAEALRAGSADVDVVTGATYTSHSYLQALQSAIDRARGRG
jgi:uncharacterized protein with FMN-binding domain